MFFFLVEKLSIIVQKSSKCLKAAGDKLLMNKFIRQNFGAGRTLKSFRSDRLGADFVET